MLLDHPWINAMEVIPSTFHQCVKSPFNGIKITIHGDLDPFQHCNYLKASVDNKVPINQAIVIISQLESLAITNMQTSTSYTPSTPPLQIKDVGCEEFSYLGAPSMGKLYLSLRSLWSPPSNLTRQDKGK